jgi:hypothetical protein
MKKSLLLFAVGCGVFFVPAGAETLSLAGPSAASGPCDLTVNLTNAFDTHDRATDAFLGCGFNIAFDPAILFFTGETPEPLFDDVSDLFPGTQVAGLASSMLLGPGDFAEPLILAVLHFNVVGSGSTSVSISGDPAVNLNQGLIYLSSEDPLSTTTRVTAAAAGVPEPGTMALAGSVLVMLWGGRRLSDRTSSRRLRS